jgi:soluble lytic murein transglycosylase
MKHRAVFLAAWVLAGTALLVRPAAWGAVQSSPQDELRAKSKAVLEKPTVAARRALQQYAREQGDSPNGAMARLVLGYSAYQERQYAQAREQFQAARTPKNPLLDYAEYYLALSALAARDHEAVTKTLDGFARRYPTSPFVPGALLRQAESLLALGRTEAVRSLLENPPGFLPEAEAAWLLAEADWKDGKAAEAVEGYRKIYYLHPASEQATVARSRLSEAERRLGAAFAGPSIALREARADGLFEARQWESARREYAPLAAMEAKRERWVVRLGASQYQAGATWPSLETLGRLEVSDPELDAERLYTLAAAYRRIGRNESMDEQVRVLGTRHPQSNWYQEALFLAGNYYRASKNPKETPRSMEFYRKVSEAFPQGEKAPVAHWYVTWQAYRDRRLAEAKALFEAHVRNYPASPQVSAALYWLGRMAEPEAPLAAAAYYQKLVETFPNYYYGLLGRERLAQLPPEIARIASPAQANFIQVTRPGNGVVPANGPSPAEAAVLSRVKILESAWLLDWANAELSDAVRNASSPFWLGLELARIEKQRGRHHVAMRYGKRHISGYFAMDMAEMPRESWEVLFPLLWWKELRSVADTTRLDPYLVAGLIRQESEFDPRARSRSNARGLMQLLPSTARYMSRRIPDRRTRSYTLASLYSPEINLIYGIHYLREVLDQFNGTVEHALAGYNAGPRRVVQWTSEGGFGEPAEFVESIPITETREYVQAVLRNAALYRKLYQPDAERAAAGGAGSSMAYSAR